MKRLLNYKADIHKLLLLIIIFALLLTIKPLQGTHIKFSNESNVSKTAVKELSVPILTYHQVRDPKPNDSFMTRRFMVSVDAFDSQMKLLHDGGYTAIGLDELLEGFDKNNLPSKPIIITFDDGYRNQYENALPILEKYGMKATFFIYTDAIDYLRTSMTWDQVKDLDKRGMIIAGHTRTHPKLIFIKDNIELYDEIQNSKIILESKLGHDIKYFAYPYGLNNERVRDEVEESGYKAAVTVEEGLIQSRDNLFKLKRFNMNTNKELEFLPYGQE